MIPRPPRSTLFPYTNALPISAVHQKAWQMPTCTPVWLSPACTPPAYTPRSEEHTSELQSPCNIVCRLLLEKKTKCQPPSSCRLPAPQRHYAQCNVRHCGRSLN